MKEMSKEEKYLGLPSERGKSKIHSSKNIINIIKEVEWS